MNIESILHFVANPIIGGCIGYFTNFIACRMLFRPKEEIKIGKHALPFTPGIIPKRKDHLARIIGETVAERMFTEEDITKIFLSEEMKNAVANSMLDALGEEEQMHSLVELMEGMMSEEEMGSLLEKLDMLMYQKVHKTILKADIAEIVSKECQHVLTEKTQGTIVSKVMTPARISSISDKVGTEMQQYTKENMEGMIMPMLREETAQVMVQPLDQILQEVQLSREELRVLIGKIYEKFIEDHSAKLVKLFDIASITEQKIIEFQVEEIEEIMNLTVQKEMKAVVNLGAVLGVLIGLVNAFIQL